MIAKLRGRLDSAGEDWAVIDVSGVGYLLYCSARTLRSLPGIGELVEQENNLPADRNQFPFSHHGDWRVALDTSYECLI